MEYVIEIWNDKRFEEHWQEENMTPMEFIGIIDVPHEVWSKPMHETGDVGGNMPASWARRIADLEWPDISEYFWITELRSWVPPPENYGVGN